MIEPFFLFDVFSLILSKQILFLFFFLGLDWHIFLNFL